MCSDSLGTFGFGSGGSRRDTFGVVFHGFDGSHTSVGLDSFALVVEILCGRCERQDN